MVSPNIIINGHFITEVDYENNSNEIDVRADLSRVFIKLSIILGLKLLLPVHKIEKSSKNGEKLQNKNCSWITVNLLLLNFKFLPVRCEMSNFSLNQTLKWLLVSPW